MAGTGACWAQTEPGLPPGMVCTLCQFDLRLWFDFTLGVALLGGLVWAISWAESASLAEIAEHLFGVGMAACVLYLFTRFLVA